MGFSDEYGDIPDYSGYCPDCPKCYTTMGFSYSKCEFKCPKCGYIMDEDDWDMDKDNDDIPFACKVCGGPFPKCETSCKMFDD